MGLISVVNPIALGGGPFDVFEAACDGVTDDIQALEAASAACAKRVSSSIILPPGLIKVSRPWVHNLNSYNPNIYGPGRFVTNIINPVGGPAIQMQSTLTNVGGGIMFPRNDTFFEMSGFGCGAIDNDAVQIQGLNWSMRNMWISSAGTTGAMINILAGGTAYLDDIRLGFGNIGESLAKYNSYWGRLPTTQPQDGIRCISNLAHFIAELTLRNIQCHTLVSRHGMHFECTDATGATSISMLELSKCRMKMSALLENTASYFFNGCSARMVDCFSEQAGSPIVNHDFIQARGDNCPTTVSVLGCDGNNGYIRCFGNQNGNNVLVYVVDSFVRRMALGWSGVPADIPLDQDPTKLQVICKNNFFVDHIGDNLVLDAASSGNLYLQGNGTYA